MIELLRKELPRHYNLNRSNIIVLNETTREKQFDLLDGGETMLVPYGTGGISFENSTQTDVEIINYEKFLNGLSGTSF